MKKNIEVEIRGFLSKDDYERVSKILIQNGKKTAEKRRTLIDYSTFLPGGVRERKKDIRIRVTNGVPEIVVKIGTWGDDESRKEFSFTGQEGQFETLKEIFGHLGYEKGIKAIRNTQAFDYKEVEIALVEVPGHSYYFEAEKMVEEVDNVELAKKEILEVIAELGLSKMSQEEFFAYIETLNKEANTVFDINES